MRIMHRKKIGVEEIENFFFVFPNLKLIQEDFWSDKQKIRNKKIFSPKKVPPKY